MAVPDSWNRQKFTDSNYILTDGEDLYVFVDGTDLYVISGGSILFQTSHESPPHANSRAERIAIAYANGELTDTEVQNQFGP